MWNADSAREEADYLSMRAMEKEQAAFEAAFERFYRENGPLYHFEPMELEADEETEAFARMHFGKRMNQLTDAQAEVMIRFFGDCEIIRGIEVLGDGTITFQEGIETDDYDGETVSGLHFEVD